MPADKPTELSRIKLKNLNSTACLMISKHSAHSTPLPVGFRAWLWWYTCLLFLMSMLWYRQAIFESKVDKLSSSTECRIRTQGLRHLFASRLNACWQTNWAIENQTKKLELDSPSLWSASIQPTRPHCQLNFAPGSGNIYMFVVVNFDALAQGSDIRIERRQVVFLCWMQDSNTRSQTPICQQTERLPTNQLSYRESS